MKSLQELLTAIEVVDSMNPSNVNVQKLAYHSGRVEPGTMFVCVRGYETDGHKFAGQAVEKGASVLVVEEFLPHLNVPQYKVENSRAALAALADKYFDHPSKDLNIIGITGTNGKTSSSFMVDSIFKEAGVNRGLIGTVMMRYGDEVIPSVLTTPESLDLHENFFRMRKSKVTDVTMEVSSSALELKRVGNVDFDYVALNNISREHVDLHGSFEAYYKAKASLIREAKEEAWAVLNLDDERSASLVNETKASVFTYAIEDSRADLHCTNVDLSTGRGKFSVRLNRPIHLPDQTIPPQSFEIELLIAGYHSIYNALCAVSMGLLNGIAIPVIQKGLNQFKGVERRFQIIYEDDFMIVDDHFANTGNINASLDTLTKMNYEELHMVYAIRGSRGVITNRESAETLAAWVSQLGLKRIIATKSQDSVGKKDTVQEEELEVFTEVMNEVGVEVVTYDTLQEAVVESLNRAKKNDLVFLAGSQGMDFGAKYILEELAERHPENKENILAPLKERVAGVDETTLQ